MKSVSIFFDKMRKVFHFFSTNSEKCILFFDEMLRNFSKLDVILSKKLSTSTFS